MPTVLQWDNPTLPEPFCQRDVFTQDGQGRYNGCHALENGQKEPCDTNQ
jgi:hypothetical protein